MPEDKWRKKLSTEAHHVLRQKGTEAPYSGNLLNNTEKGMYICGACGAELFSSDSKYDSKTPGLMGWPSFGEAVNSGAVEFSEDKSHGMNRTEVTCTKCGSHLGHVFEADDSPTGQHYCINSVALNFKKSK
ncbi:peptide-methionine (R)-S-oxide reductase MsrB [Candidatus Saccharibacteria bacterium]|nr:peptide-methionine (R)-S-oxide reductase MsrB [Candidatus Saccharibacteria bacterium]